MAISVTKTELGSGIPAAALVCIGDELNRGEILDTNAAWLATELYALGIAVRWRFGVNDQPEDIAAALRIASQHAAIVLVSGGLGPTSDDLTVDVAAGLGSTTPVSDPEHEQRLRARFASRGLPLSDSALRQTRHPSGATVLANPIGFAPGFVLSFGSSQLYFLPGVPAELRAIFAAEVSPRLRVQLPTGRAIQRTAVRVFGLGESEVNQRLSDLLSSPQPSASDPTRTSQHFQSTLHYRIAFPEILVTFITAGATQQAIAQEQARLLQGLRDRLGDAAYSYSHLADGGDGLPVLVGETLRARRSTVATAESCTGGLIGASLTSVPGSSDYFIGGIISYANAVKQQLLGVSTQTLAAHGAVSRPCVEEMARGVRQLLGTTYGVAVSGVAGPGGGSPEKPVGTVFFAVATPEGCLTDQILWPGEREPLRQLATAYALRLLLKAVLA